MTIYNLPQSTIKVSAAFYNEDEKQKLLKYPSAKVIEQLVSKDIDVPTAEFLTYYLFHRKRLGVPRYGDYDAIGNNIHQALAILDGCIDFTGHSICTAQGVEHQLNEISEHIGESVGLSIVSRIHGLTSADWDLIEPKQGPGAPPTFDYQIASDGAQFIQAENKGSSVSDNNKLSPAVRTHKSTITKKKKKLHILSQQGLDPYPANIRYGTITAVDPRRDGCVKCWLVDPEPEKLNRDPRHFKLLTRMRFLWAWLSLISPRSQLSSALATRLIDLETLQNPFELDNVQILRGNGKPFEFMPTNILEQHSTFMAHKSHVMDGPAGGLTVQISDDALFLLGIREDLLFTAVDQNFDKITTYKTEAGTIEKTVECVFSRHRFERLRLPPSIRKRTQESGGYFRFPLSGMIHYSDSGLAFGVLPLPKE